MRPSAAGFCRSVRAASIYPFCSHNWRLRGVPQRFRATKNFLDFSDRQMWVCVHQSCDFVRSRAIRVFNTKVSDTETRKLFPDVLLGHQTGKLHKSYEPFLQCWVLHGSDNALYGDNMLSDIVYPSAYLLEEKLSWSNIISG